MAMNLFTSGYATLAYEIAERGRQRWRGLGQRLENALTALAEYPRTADSNREIRKRLVEQAGYRSGCSSCSARPAASTRWTT